MLRCGIAYRSRREPVIKKIKQESDQFPPGNPYGVVAKTGVPPDPSAGDDAAADAGHQAAAALQPRSGRLCRGRAGDEPAARARRDDDEGPPAHGRRPKPTSAASGDDDDAGARRLDRRGAGDQPQLHGAGARHRTGKRLSRRRRREARAGRSAAAEPIRNGRAPALAAATTTTIWKPSSRPRPRSPIIWPSRWRWPSPIRSRA